MAQKRAAPGWRPGGGWLSCAGKRAHSSPAARFSQDPRFQLLTQRLHRLGERATGELLLELARDHGIERDILARLEIYADLDPAIVARLGARDWPPPLLHEMAV